ncbi:monovalent cation/H(+) antiporter subunit G [Emcibacter sp.]|uniref:monovalent cation/H(+) antiporter subunit G n=1 Tax=Emcibacter sp. TaxID=1979954 RepID=UPI002AA6CCE1|nr:monovalent cation/H(+) antiporter subunit G [Emcibacter sp.]
MELVADILSWILLLSGSFFVFAGGIGFLRMPDLYSRMHASSLTESLGAILILIGLMVQGGFTLVTVKLIIMLFFLLFTSPTAAYALANAALLAGVKPKASLLSGQEKGSDK